MIDATFERVLQNPVLERLPRRVIWQLSLTAKTMRTRLQNFRNAFWRGKLMREFYVAPLLAPVASTETPPDFYFERYLSHVPTGNVSAGSCYSVAIDAAGNVAGWGVDNARQATGGAAAFAALPDATNRRLIAVSAGTMHSLGLLDNGQVIGWGDDSFQKATGAAFALATLCDAFDRYFIAISAGGSHSLGLLDNGQVVGWGCDTYCRASGAAAALSKLPNAKKRHFVAISAGENHSLGLLDNGEVIGWGWDRFQAVSGAAVALQKISDHHNRRFVAISAGYAHSLGLLDDGRVVHWGCDGGAWRTIDVETLRAVCVAASSVSIMLSDNGKIVCVGGDPYRAADELQKRAFLKRQRIVAVHAGNGRHALAVLANGQLIYSCNDHRGLLTEPPSDFRVKVF